MNLHYYPHPEQFETDTTPTLHADDNRVQYQFDTVLAREGRKFFCLDYLFEKRDEGLSGAVGTVMMPRHEDVVEREMERLRDRERSQLASRYEAEDPVVGWDKWINSQLDKDGASLYYDDSYSNKYGEQVIDCVERDNIMEREEVALVECVRGGRLYDIVRDRPPRIYDDELYRLVKCAEQSGMRNMYDTPSA